MVSFSFPDIPRNISVHTQTHSYVLTAIFDFNIFPLIIKKFKMDEKALPDVYIMR